MLISILYFIGFNSKAQRERQIFEFEFEGLTLNGLLNLPKDQEPKGIVLILHGSGKTNAVEGSWKGDIRKTIVESGYATYMWDKMGCGKSGGTFDYNQSVFNSAEEAIAAINALKKKNIPGSEEIGLYGGSRGSWVNPIVINQYDGIKFWITVSGVDDKENWGYLFQQNLRIGGMPEDSVQLLHEQWIEGTRIFHSGGSYEEYLSATTAFRSNPFRLRFNGETIGELDEAAEREKYYSGQKAFMKEKLDEETGLLIVIDDFDEILSKVKIPVLALFGEKDMNVDWKKTKAYYEKTITPNANLTTKSFPNCNHDMIQCETGGFYEFDDNDLPIKRCDGFLDVIKEWLKKIEE